MRYIGKSPHFGVRNRFVYLASADDSSVSGADVNGATLTFTDGAYVDVYLNGVLLKPTTDYNTNTANTIAGLSAMSANDEITVIVFDVFSVSDTVSATSGGTFSGAVTANSTLDMNGTELILDADGDTSITADTDDQIDFKVNNIDSFLVGQDYVEVKGVHPDLYIIDTDDGSNNQAGLFYNNGVLSISADHSNVANNSAMVFFTDGTERARFNTAGNLAFANGKGIDFSATADGSSASFSELFDDYEEGVFGTSVTTETSGTITLNGSYNNMRYTKVGRLVTVNADIRISSVSSPVGGLKIAIPYATQNTGHSSSASVVGSCITHGLTKQTDQVGRFVVIAGSNQTF